MAGEGKGSIWQVVVGASVIIGLLAGGFALYQGYKARVDSFGGELIDPPTADRLISTLNSNDSRVVQLDVRCLAADTTVCDPDTASAQMNSDVLIVRSSSGTYWLFIQIPSDSDAVATNGRGGAGNLEVSGRFRVRKYENPNVPASVISVNLLGTTGQTTN